jgi:hypothetical protein
MVVYEREAVITEHPIVFLQVKAVMKHWCSLRNIRRFKTGSVTSGSLLLVPDSQGAENHTDLCSLQQIHLQPVMYAEANIKNCSNAN